MMRHDWIRARAASLALSAGLLFACGSTEPPPASTEAPTSPSPPPDPPASSCGAATDCEACLAIDDCNWTADQCASACFMDTYCVGPGNPSAPTCVAGVTILGDWQEDMAAAEGDVRVFVRGSVELGPARFRRTMTFEDATEERGPVFRTNVLAPDDGHGTAEGTWSISGDQLTVRYRPDAAAVESVEVYTLIESGSQRLRLRPVTP